MYLPGFGHLREPANRFKQIKPDEKICFRHATCWLPQYTWEDIYAFSKEAIEKYQEFIESAAHLIMEFSNQDLDYKIWEMLSLP